MNRIILKVKLLKSFGLELELVHLDTRFQSGDNEFLNYYTDDKVFMMYSKSDLSLTVNTLRLPDRKNYKPNQKHTHYFNDETDRYIFLRNLRRSLIEWSTKFEGFRYCTDHKNRNRNLILSKEFWIM